MAAMKVIRRNLTITVAVLITMLFASNIVVSGRNAQTAAVPTQGYAVEEQMQAAEYESLEAFDIYAG